jgi:arylsulfatase A-like enzyme
VQLKVDQLFASLCRIFWPHFLRVMSRMDDLGGPLSFNHYPIGWAHCMDTPFQWTKQMASHFGGTRNGMVMSWPTRIKDKGGIRTQFHHVIDIAPTILEAVGLQLGWYARRGKGG